MARRHLARGSLILLAFFLGGVVSSIAFDFSDFEFYQASASGNLSATQQPVWFTLFPALFYMGFFFLAYIIGRTGLVSPVFVLYFYFFLVVIAAVLGLQLPQASSTFYTTTIFVGTAVSAGVIYGLLKQVKGG